MFIIKDSDQYITIDCGNKRETVSGELMKLNIESDKIVAILLTHTDVDHIAAVKLFKNAKLYFSELEEQMINGSKHRFPLSYNNIDNEEFSLIADQQILKIGNVKIKGISTPGHTLGSICYLINDKYLFTGDALRLKDGKVQEFIKFINMDSKTAFTSIHKITQIPEAEFIFTSHHGFTNDFKYAVKNW